MVADMLPVAVVTEDDLLHVNGAEGLATIMVLADVLVAIPVNSHVTGATEQARIRAEAAMTGIITKSLKDCWYLLPAVLF